MYRSSPDSGNRSRASVVFGFALGFGLFLPIGLAYLLLLIGLILPWVDQRRRRAWNWPDSGWLWILGLFLAWPAIRAGFGWYEDSGARLLHHLRIVLTIWVGLTLPNAARKTLVLGAVVGALWATGIALTNQSMHLPEWCIWYNLIAVRGNASSQKWIAMATLAGVLFAISVHPFADLRHKTIMLIASLWLTACVAWFSVSRNAHLLLVVLPAAALLHRRTHLRVTLPVLGAALTLVSVIGSNAPNVIDRVGTASTELNAFINGNPSAGGVADRLSMLSASVEMIKESPIFGHGPGAWRSKWASRSGADPRTVYNNPHNDFLLWWIEGGLLGLVTLILVLSRLAHDCWKDPTPRGAVGWVLVTSIILTSTVNATFRDAQIGMMILLLASAMSVRRPERKKPA